MRTQKIPALGGRTPIEAVRDPDGKEAVEALLLQFERHDQNKHLRTIFVPISAPFAGCCNWGLVRPDSFLACWYVLGRQTLYHVGHRGGHAVDLPWRFAVDPHSESIPPPRSV
jgi:hypothetical protein